MHLIQIKERIMAEIQELEAQYPMFRESRVIDDHLNEVTFSQLRSGKPTAKPEEEPEPEEPKARATEPEAKQAAEPKPHKGRVRKKISEEDAVRQKKEREAAQRGETPSGAKIVPHAGSLSYLRLLLKDKGLEYTNTTFSEQLTTLIKTHRDRIDAFLKEKGLDPDNPINVDNAARHIWLADKAKELEDNDALLKKNPEAAHRVKAETFKKLQGAQGDFLKKITVHEKIAHGAKVFRDLANHWEKEFVGKTQQARFIGWLLDYVKTRYKSEWDDFETRLKSNHADPMGGLFPFFLKAASEFAEQESQYIAARIIDSYIIPIFEDLEKVSTEHPLPAEEKFPTFDVVSKDGKTSHFKIHAGPIRDFVSFILEHFTINFNGLDERVFDHIKTFLANAISESGVKHIVAERDIDARIEKMQEELHELETGRGKPNIEREKALKASIADLKKELEKTHSARPAHVFKPGEKIEKLRHEIYAMIKKELGNAVKTPQAMLANLTDKDIQSIAKDFGRNADRLKDAFKRRSKQRQVIYQPQSGEKRFGPSDEEREERKLSQEEHDNIIKIAKMYGLSGDDKKMIQAARKMDLVMLDSIVRNQPHLKQLMPSEKDFNSSDPDVVDSAQIMYKNVIKKAKAIYASSRPYHTGRPERTIGSEETVAAKKEREAAEERERITQSAPRWDRYGGEMEESSNAFSGFHNWIEIEKI